MVLLCPLCSVMPLTLGLQPDLSSCGTDIFRYVLWAVLVAIPLTWPVVKGVTVYHSDHASTWSVPHSSYYRWRETALADGS